MAVIKSLLSDITYAEKSPSGLNLSEGGPETVLIKAIKKRRDSVEAYRQGNREDLVKQELSEIEIIESFLPKQFTMEQIEEAVRKVAVKVGAKSVKDMGKIMKEIGTEIPAGSASKKDISEAVKKVLASA
ncbi:hypothetical protein HDU76_010663 [Blyttiomyces sp. JEL0837]|nr:hypothetical protein HDU76_010663 [Blyttiomyces sp. JEL0837]